MFLFHEPTWNKVYFGLGVAAVGLSGLLLSRIRSWRKKRPSFDPNRFQLEQDTLLDAEEEEVEEPKAPIPLRPPWNIRHRLPIRLVSGALLGLGLVYSLIAYRAISNFEDATRLVGKHDLPRAEAAFKKALSSLPDSPLVRAQLADVLVGMNRYKEALPEYERSLSDDNENRSTHVSYANTLMTVGRVDEAIVQYQKALVLAPPDDYVIYIDLGNAFVRARRFDDAYKQYRYVLDKDPKNIVAHLNLGDALRAGGRIEEGIEECRQSVALAPDNAIVRNNLGNAYYSAGKREEAIAEYRKATEVQPDYPAGYFNLANALMDKPKPQNMDSDQRQEAIKALESFLRLAQDHPEYAQGIPKANEYLKKLQGGS